LKALLKKSPGPGAVYISAPDAAPAPDEVLVKVHRASICGSDLPIYNWTSWAPSRVKTPMVFGHEFCGVVAAIGRNARGFEKGDFVSVESHIYCGLCHQCRNGERHVCQNLKIIGVDGPGGFAEYARVPARCAWKHPDRSLADYGSLFEPLGNAVFATLVEDVVGRCVLVTGCGPQGLFAIQVAKASGASPIAAVEGSPFRRKLALKMGADYVFDPGETNVLGKIRRLAGDRAGVDVVLEMSGASPAIQLALEAVRPGGRITAFGLPSKPVTIDWERALIFKGVRIYGILGREIFQTWLKMDKLLRSGQLNLKPVVTHEFPLKDFKKAFEVMTSPERKCGKVLLEIGG
jgi:threonine 3-dehydrogenase